MVSESPVVLGVVVVLRVKVKNERLELSESEGLVSFSMPQRATAS
jgi:hypothetical protein